VSFPGPVFPRRSSQASRRPSCGTLARRAVRSS
jgi:hypothetical protein